MKRTERIGDSTMQSIDNLTPALAAMEARIDRVVSTAALEVKRALIGIQERQGDGSWPENSPTTVRLKGHEEIMVDEGDLKSAIDIRPDSSRIHARNIGWFDEMHRADMTMAQLANLHDEGREPMFPARPWISQLAYRDDLLDPILARMRVGVSAAMVDPSSTATALADLADFMDGE